MNKAISSLLQSDKKEDVIASMCLLNDECSSHELQEREMQDMAAKVLNRLGGNRCFGRLFTLWTFPKVQYESLKFFINCCQFGLVTSIDKELLQPLIQLLLTSNDPTLNDLLIISIKFTVKLNISPHEAVYVVLSHPALSTAVNPFSSLSLITDLLSQSTNSPLSLATAEAVALQTVIIRSLHGAVKEESRDISLDHLSHLLAMSTSGGNHTLHPAWTIATNTPSDNNIPAAEEGGKGKSSSFPVFLLSLMSVEVRLSCEELLEILKHTLPTTLNTTAADTTPAKVLETRLHRTAGVLPDCLSIISSCLQLLTDVDDDKNSDDNPLWQSLPAQDLLAINRSLRDMTSSFLDFIRSLSQLAQSSTRTDAAANTVALSTAKSTVIHILAIINKLLLQDFELCNQVFSQDHVACLWQYLIWLSGYDTETIVIEAVMQLPLAVVYAMKEEELVKMMPKELPVLLSERLVDCFGYVVKMINHCLIQINSTHKKMIKQRFLTTLTNTLTIAIYTFSLKKDDLQLLSRGEGQVGAISSVFGQSAMQAIEQMMKIPPAPQAEEEQDGEDGEVQELEMEAHMLAKEFAQLIQELQDIHIRSAAATTRTK